MEFVAEVNKVGSVNDISVFDPFLVEDDLGYNHTPLPQASSGGTSSKFAEQIHCKPIISSQNSVSSPSIFPKTTFSPPQHPTVTSNLSQLSISPTSPAFAPKIIVNASDTKLSFDPDNVDFFVQRFESLHRHNNLSSAELFDQLFAMLKLPTTVSDAPSLDKWSW